MAGRTDTVPAMLTPGEFVIKQESAAMLGEPFLRKLNAVSDNAAHSNIDALIGQAQLANMKPMYGGGEVVPGYQEGGSIYESLLSDRLKNFDEGAIRKKVSKKYGEPAVGDTDLTKFFGSKGLEMLKEDSGVDPNVEIDLSKAMIDKLLVQKAFGGKLGQILSIPASEVGEGKGLRYYEGVGQFRGSLPDERLQYSAIRDAIRKMTVTPQDSIPKALLGYQEGGGVGEAGRKYPPGTLMSPFMGDQAPVPEAWMQPATESMPSPEEVAEFDRMIKTLQAQELMRKMKEMQELGMFSDKEAVEYRDEDIQFPVRREGYLQR
jgi:hypothetical protein